MSTIDQPSCEPSNALNVPESSQEMVQISANTLATLLSSIETLRNDVSTLQNKVSTLDQSHQTVSSQLLILRKNSGAAFPLFSQLPIELRTMIWRYALTSIPQIHVLADDIMSRSNVNAVAVACKEAWKLAEELQLDHFLVDHFLIETVSGVTHAKQGVCKNYVNFDIDTFWIDSSLAHPHAYVPLSNDARCGKHDLCPRIGSEMSPFPIRTLAIHASSWQDPKPVKMLEDGSSKCSDGTVDALWRYQVQELLIVVGDVKFLSPHTVFVQQSTGHPRVNLRKKILGAGFDRKQDVPWSTLEERIIEALQAYKDQRATWRKEQCEAWKIPMSEIDNYDLSLLEHLHDLSGWKIPSVRFVSARPSGREWIVRQYCC